MANVDAFDYRASDAFRLEASKIMLAPADATYNLIRIPKFAFVTDVWIQIISGFTLNASVVVGWMGNKEVANEDGFIDNGLADPLVPGFKRSFNVAAGTFPAKYFSAAGGAITATVLDNLGAVGNFRVFASFVVIVE